MAPDSGTSSTANGGTFNLSNNSILGVINTVLGTTIVNFNDATDSLLIGQNAGQYEFSGAINGFEQGDTIGLMTSSTSPATPSYLQYDSTTDELNVFNASGAQIGQLHLVGNFVTAGFSLTQSSSSTFATANGYSSQYSITYSTPLYWAAGVTGEIDTGTNWVGGASPQSGGVAVLQAGTIDIDNSQFVPTPLTLDVGTSVANAYAASVSNIAVTQNFLPSNLTIDNTSAGGSITSTSVNGPVIASRLDVTGFSTSDATINVGAGDAEQIRVMEQSPTASANAATTNLWADDEHLAAAGQQLEANYYKSLIETATPTVGETLTANPAVVNGSGSNFTYQWQALASGQTIWSNISGAMGSTFAVASAEIGDEIRVQTTFTDSSTGAVVSTDSAPTLAVSTPCYCRGALILTDRGEVAVERLEVGDKVLTIGGESRPIKWMGTRSFDGRFVGGNCDILPICIRAGALEDNVPSRDLWLSPITPSISKAC
jgi:hypothetical protein